MPSTRVCIPISSILLSLRLHVHHKRETILRLYAMDACYFNRKLTQVYSCQHSIWDLPQESQPQYHHRQCSCLEDYMKSEVKCSLSMHTMYINCNCKYIIILWVLSNYSKCWTPVLPVATGKSIILCVYMHIIIIHLLELFHTSTVLETFTQRLGSSITKAVIAKTRNQLIRNKQSAFKLAI